MGRKIALFCTLIGVLAFVASPVCAEVQNIKISGDFEALAVYRNNYDLEGGNLRIQVNPAADELRSDDQDSFLMSIVRLRLDADLTDNVSACIRLANLREWDADRNIDTTLATNDLANLRWAGRGNNTGVNEDDASIILDLAYVTLKEMLYSPLTLVIGRQELNYGTGLIVGNGLYQDPNNSIGQDDLSPLHGYDAVRAIFDYDPWTLNVVVAKMIEADDGNNLPFVAAPPQGADRDSDTDLYGVNLAHRFPKYEAEMEGYVWYKRDENYDLQIAQFNNVDGPDRTFEENQVLTIGLRGSVVPIENWSVMGEFAGQAGEITDDDQTDWPSTPDSHGLSRNRGGMLAYLGTTYVLPDWRFIPDFGLEYLYLSGEEIGGVTDVEREEIGTFEAWDPMYRGKVMGSIRDRLESIYTTNDPADTSGLTNQHTIKSSLSLDLNELVDGLNFDLAILHYWFAETPSADGDNEIGSEVDVAITYDYTEDVQFALNSAWFMPGDYYDGVQRVRLMRGGGVNTRPAAHEPAIAARNRVANDNAVSVVGSCKVTF